MGSPTPTPWKAIWNNDGSFEITANDDRVVVAKRGQWPNNREQSIANAKLIVKAVNSHDALLSAAKDAFVALPMTKHNELINAALKAAIALAEGSTPDAPVEKK